MTFREPPGSQPPAGIIDDLHIVVILSPVITHEQHRVSLQRDRDPSARGGDPSDLMDRCSPTTRGTTSHQRSRLLTTSGRTVCRKTSRTRSEEC